MEYPSIRGEDILDCARNDTWNLLHIYIDSNGQKLIYQYPVYGVKSISRLQSQFKNMTFSEKADIIDCFRK